MKSWWSCLGPGVAVMVAGLCSCSVPAGTDNDGVDFVVFQDPDSEFSTTDVMDIDADIVRFDDANGQIIWAEDGTTEDGWNINGNLLQGGFFTVAFGTENGQRGAYFTETATATICDISANGGAIRITATNTPVPQE